MQEGASADAARANWTATKAAGNGVRVETCSTAKMAKTTAKAEKGAARSTELRPAHPSARARAPPDAAVPGALREDGEA